jgi:hypothetical protein
MSPETVPHGQDGFKPFLPQKKLVKERSQKSSPFVGQHGAEADELSLLSFNDNAGFLLAISVAVAPQPVLNPDIRDV